VKNGKFIGAEFLVAFGLFQFKHNMFHTSGKSIIEEKVSATFYTS